MTGTLTPMMQQYMQIKQQHEDCLVFYRLGDFYEMFFDDALVASKELELTLTGRDCGLDERAPMCGVPYHSVDAYITKLIEGGHKIAICEQIEDPALAKGLVERAVTRVITPGTVIEERILDQAKNNYIMSMISSSNGVGIAYCDVSTGEFCTYQLPIEKCMESFFDEFSRISPIEMIVDETTFENVVFKKRVSSSCYCERVPKAYFSVANAEERLKKHYKVASLEGYGVSDMELAIAASGALLRYLEETQKNALSHIHTLKLINRSTFMQLDAVTRRNLELTVPIRYDGSPKNTLLYLMNKTCTAMGGRMLKRWIDCPLQSVEEIVERQDAINTFFDNMPMRKRVRENLREVYDIERLSSKIAYQTVTPRDCIALINSLRHIVPIMMLLGGEPSEALSRISNGLDPMDDIAAMLERAIAPEPPALQKDGGYIKDGYNSEVDELRSISKQSNEWLERLAADEREATGIKNLRIGYNRVFGYYIEITKSNVLQVPYYYERKQTLANAERYITPQLKELEEKILTANDRLIVLEAQLYAQIKEVLLGCSERLQLNAKLIAELDCYQSLGEVAATRKYVRPTISQNGKVVIKDGRHPIVESNMRDAFIPNDVCLDTQDNRLLIITGPNMAGKSTYMRQVALIVLMAHIGSYVPASEASIGIVDRIFTRIGASDDLSSGQSTFMVEMSEMANIINNATNKSLLILDEIGRGTSTFDGLSIAWSVLEHIANPILCGAKTLFATHYHELSELEGKLDGIMNYRITVKEIGDDIIFLRKIVRGSGDKSFGIQAAKMAGLPSSIIERSKEILVDLEHSDILYQHTDESQAVEASEESKIEKKVIADLRSINPDSLTPMDALKKLYDYKEVLRN